ncbi:MAG TPA: NnrU family protein, partial [Beijerinckiaceae bacterium]|nr:NnrU family protein [Beijerinckiaceae bacterium]
MALLILGLVIFLGAHAFSMARAPRAALMARLGEGPYKGLYALASLIG